MSSPAKKTEPLLEAWPAKTVAGVLLGFLIAIGVSGLIAWLTPGGLAYNTKNQVVMWSVAPIWMLIVSFCFLFRSGLSAWLWLGGAAVAVNGALWALRTFLPSLGVL